MEPSDPDPPGTQSRLAPHEVGPGRAAVYPLVPGRDGGDQIRITVPDEIPVPVHRHPKERAAVFDVQPVPYHHLHDIQRGLVAERVVDQRVLYRFQRAQPAHVLLAGLVRPRNAGLDGVYLVGHLFVGGGHHVVVSILALVPFGAAALSVPAALVTPQDHAFHIAFYRIKPTVYGLVRYGRAFAGHPAVRETAGSVPAIPAARPGTAPPFNIYPGAGMPVSCPRNRTRCRFPGSRSCSWI